MGRIAIIGAGMSGLSAAHELLGDDLDVQVFEAGPRVGGRLGRIEMPGGLDLPLGADNFLSRRPEMIDLAVELGLGDTLHPPAARSARIFRDGELYPIPPSMLGIPTDLEALAGSGLVSAEGLARARQDLDAPDDRPSGDESVGALVRRRLGDEILEYVVDPLLGGINAGDSDRLSIVSGVPQIGAARDRGPSLIDSALAGTAGASDDSPVFLSPEGGVETMAWAIEERVRKSPNGRLHTGVPVDRIDPVDDGWIVAGDRFGSAIVATPASSAARLLAPHSPDAATRLGSIEYSSVAMVLVVLDPGTIDLDPAMSGILVPRLEGRWVTAISIASNKWPELAPAGQQILRVSVGRRTDTRWQDLDDAALVSLVLADLRDLIGLDTPPAHSAVHRWMHALPQYDVDHGTRIDEIEAAVHRDTPGVELAGAALRGLGLPACVASGRRAARLARDYIRTRA